MPSRKSTLTGFLLAVVLAATGSLLIAVGCDRRTELHLQGQTMGTVYTVRAFDVPASAKTKIEAEIISRLEQVNAALSVYRPDSEVSRFNAPEAANRPFPVSKDFQNVLSASILVHELTQGAFDPTVKPLLDLWGFGPASPKGEARRPPDLQAVRYALESVGLHKVDAADPDRPRKSDPRVQLDFGGVAKGYALDQVAALLHRHGIDDFLVDIGGDILASGTSPDEGRAWRIGVNRPAPDAAWDDVLMVLHLRDKAVVTSGDYRRFFLHGERLYGHVLDPRSGLPAQNAVAGVTVLAAEAVFADALATGLMVLGFEEGAALVDSLPGVEALFVLRDDAGGFTVRMSAGFASAAGLDAD